jgi:hypothetical protein
MICPGHTLAESPVVSAVLWALLLGSPLADRPDTVVVCPNTFRTALQPWVDYRVQQGHRLVFVSNELTTDAIRQQIRAAAEGGALRFVVLVGDADPRLYYDSAVRARCVPAHYTKAKVIVAWGSESHIGTDNGYATADDTPMPRVAVGRLSAQTPEQLSQIVAKILAYERSTDFGPWRRQVNLVAGMGGFGVLLDTLIESTARHFISTDIPQTYQASITYGSWRSPFCPDPRRFRESTLERLNEGSLFWVYIGHGSHLWLDHVRVPNGEYPILDADDIGKIHCRHGAPIALFLACYTGAFDAAEDCMAERMLREPDGPVAVVASSRVGMPYAMAVMSTELMDECFRLRTATLGEALLHAKQRMVRQSKSDRPSRVMLDALASAASPGSASLAAERIEHVQLFNLLGDPLLRLQHPKVVDMILTPASPGETLKVAGVTPVAGRCTVELVVPRGTLTFSPPARREYPQNADEQTQFQDVYTRANDGRLAMIELPVSAGRFETLLSVPVTAPRRCYVRAYVEGRDDFAAGAAAVQFPEDDRNQTP